MQFEKCQKLTGLPQVLESPGFRKVSWKVLELCKILEKSWNSPGINLQESYLDCSSHICFQLFDTLTLFIVSRYCKGLALSRGSHGYKLLKTPTF